MTTVLRMTATCACFSAALLVGCGGSETIVGTTAGGGGSGNGGDAAGPGNGGSGGTTTSGAGSTGAGTSTTTSAGTGTTTGNCVATCCDGSTESGDQADAQECKFYEGFACQDNGGPKSIEFNGSTVWSAPGGCPSMHDCKANCCNGDVKIQGQQFDADLCNFFAMADGVCDQSGGVAKVFFDGEETLNKVAWSGSQTACGNCLATCCDGYVVGGNQADAGACHFWQGVPCNDQGGPQKIEFQGNVTWGPAASCPSAKECKLVCNDGESLVNQAFDKDMCVFFNVAGDFCNGHAGNNAVYYGGQKVWP